MTGLRLLFGLVIVFEVLAPVRADNEAEQTAKVQFFESKVRPLLIEQCQRCHGPDQQKSGLRVDSRAALLAGGETGPAIEPSKPEGSLLIDAVNYKTFQMPPDRRLTADQIAILTKWVADGAIWPNSGEPTGPVVRKPGLQITAVDRREWIYQPIQRPEIPDVQALSQVHHPIDRFLLAKLESRGLTLSPPAEPRTLLRRLKFDLIGLPPTADDIKEFAADASPAAYERRVDELLASPAYGERWGRHWLDLVRFAQTNGYERDDEKPQAWRYRDYVISALNADKPYDQFVREQLAGDELDVVTDESIVATGYYRLGVWDDEPDDMRQAEFDDLDDMLSTTGSVFLGLTIGCARCHDHKFDPITQEDYYSLLAFLRNVKRYVKPDDKAAMGTIFANLAQGGQALAVFEQGAVAPDVHVLARGNAATPGAKVTARFPLVFGADAGAVTPQPPTLPEGSSTARRRRQVAEWLTHPQHPLTARVVVNRLWQHHFGTGLTPTPSDFGRTGVPCQHPELLDYLASELISSGWSLKHIHRLIVTSAAYRQSSRGEQPRAVELDPGNTLVWRQNLRRLEAEAIRDATLATAGTLNREMFGRGIFPELSAEVLSTQSIPGRGWDKSPKAQQHRRSVYIFMKRTLGVPLLDTFDLPSPDTSQAARNTTTIAPQALILLNSAFADEQAAAFADRVLSIAPADEDVQIHHAFEFALARSPSDRERHFAMEYLARQKSFWRTEGDQLRRQLAAQQMQDQPVSFANWSKFGGEWSLPEPGVCLVEPSPGGKLVRDDVEFQDGQLDCEVRLTAGGDGGLLLRVSDAKDGTDALSAYNINFTPTKLRLGKHRNNWMELVAADVKFAPDDWVRLRVTATGGRLQLFVGGATEPAIDYTDAEPLTTGKIGLRTFQAKVAFRNLRVQQGSQTIDLNWSRAPEEIKPLDDAGLERAAWTDLCKILLNLNEFVYVD